jgi:CheY-like chemotaxis protein
MAKTVLVIEDEPTVLMFLEEGLAECGYDVISARSGGEALNVLGSGLHGIDVLVADIRIGDGLDGWEIARCAREISPGLPIVYVTGDSAASWADQGVTNSVLLPKPFTRHDLAGAIETLNPPPRAEQHPALHRTDAHEPNAG